MFIIKLVDDDFSAIDFIIILALCFSYPIAGDTSKCTKFVFVSTALFTFQLELSLPSVEAQKRIVSVESCSGRL